MTDLYDILSAQGEDILIVVRGRHEEAFYRLYVYSRDGGMDDGLSPGDIEDKWTGTDGEVWGHLMVDDDSKPFHVHHNIHTKDETHTTLPKNKAVLKRLLDARRIIKMLLLS